jgi:methylmalonyl-CoA/ethylmalonyl-CoA epimerase
MKLDHIGYLTDQMDDSREAFVRLGYVSEAVVDFPAHKSKVCFLRKEGETTVELVEPYEENKSLRKLLKNGVTPYHVCYEVEDIEKSVSDLTGGYFALSQPVPAPAFDGRLICYLWSRETGYIELVSGS